MTALEAENLRLTHRAAAAESAARAWQALAEYSGLAACAMDRGGKILWLTAAAMSVLGMPASPPGAAAADIAAHLDGADLGPMVRQVIESQAAAAFPVTTGGGRFHHLMRLLPYGTADGATTGVVASFGAAGQSAAGPSLATQVQELNHRIRNMTQMVLSVASGTRRRSRSLDEFSRSFSGRILAMGRTQDMVAGAVGTAMALRDLVLRQLLPYAATPDSIVANGAALHLTPNAALALDLVLHELATNAAKHGALSGAAGRVEVGWSLAGEGIAGRLVITWEEHGGPPVPSRLPDRGFGSELMERQVRHGLGGTIALNFAATGLRATIALPLGVLLEPWRPARPAAH